MSQQPYALTYDTRCEWKRCRAPQMHRGEQAVTVLGFGLNTRPKTYHPACYEARERARKWAQRAEHARAVGFSRVEDYDKWSKERAGERANARYWERVDNYRELGYDPGDRGE